MSRVRGQRVAMLGRAWLQVGRQGSRSEEMNEVRELDMGLALRGKAFQAEGTAGAEALRQERSQVGLRKNGVHVTGAE